MATRFKFVIEFECDKDGVKGWGNQVEDWIALATEAFKRQSHYHTEFKVVSTEEIKRARSIYQIRREQTEEGYSFALIKYKAGKAVLRLGSAEGRSPIAPRWLLDMQARLNTRAALDSKYGYLEQMH